jgi:hypothetical protein
MRIKLNIQIVYFNIQIVYFKILNVYQINIKVIQKHILDIKLFKIHIKISIGQSNPIKTSNEGLESDLVNFVYFHTKIIKIIFNLFKNNSFLFFFYFFY